MTFDLVGSRCCYCGEKINSLYDRGYSENYDAPFALKSVAYQVYHRGKCDLKEFEFKTNAQQLRFF